MNCRGCGSHVADLPQSVCPNCDVVNWTTEWDQDKVLALDFDGVIHRYSKGWADGTIYDPPIEGSIAAIKKLQHAGWELIIFTCREDKRAIRAWLINWWPIEACIQPKLGLSEHLKVQETRICNAHPIPQITNNKPGAVAYIDDRAYHFKGWKEVLLDFARP